MLDAVTFAALRSLQADTVLLAAFLQDTGPRLATVRAAFAAGRPADARDALHNLRSTAGQLGAAQMAAVVEHLYQAVRTNQPCDPRWLADLDRTWLILQPMLVAMQRLS